MARISEVLSSESKETFVAATNKVFQLKYSLFLRIEIIVDSYCVISPA